jgi:hypothetical protein
MQPNNRAASAALVLPEIYHPENLGPLIQFDLWLPPSYSASFLDSSAISSTL